MRLNQLVSFKVLVRVSKGQQQTWGQILKVFKILNVFELLQIQVFVLVFAKICVICIQILFVLNNGVKNSCNYYLINIMRKRNFFTLDAAKRTIVTLVLSRLCP